MWDEDNEAVEGEQTEVSEAPEAPEAPEPVEDSSEPVETQSVEDTSEPAPEVFDWNGELEGLRQEQWFNELNETMQGSMLRGFENKYQNWARGYQKKFDELSKQRREADKTLEAAREQELKVMKWLHGDVDPMREKQREIDNLKVAHKSALETLRERAEMEHEKIKTSFGSELEGAVKARDQAIQQHVELQGQIEAYENSVTEQEVDNIEEYMVEHASDIYENDEAFDDFILAWKAGADIDKAVKMVRALYPQEVAPEPEPEPEPEPVPEGMKLMNMKPDTAAATEGGNPQSFEDMMMSLKKEGQREAELIRNA
tara:strand:- start:3065 stop:4006 length:942 start_codon:yes stop_codon:yes gene_type:complete